MSTLVSPNVTINPSPNEIFWQAASGIGKETAFALAQAGVEGVILADLNHSGSESVAQESQRWATHPKFRATAVQVDVSDEAAVNDMVDAAIKEFGRIDYCVHSAGVGSEETKGETILVHGD